MKKIEAYKVGSKIFESKEQAEKYENDVKLALDISNFVEHHFTYGMSTDMILETIIENIEELKQIIK